MIEITCSKEEKEKLIKALENMQLQCFFSPKKSKFCSVSKNNCRNCLETRIKWNVK